MAQNLDVVLDKPMRELKERIAAELNGVFAEALDNAIRPMVSRLPGPLAEKVLSILDSK